MTIKAQETREGKRFTSDDKVMLAQAFYGANFESMEDAYNTLNERDRKILADYFGFYGQEQKTYEEIGKELGIVKERVRQIKERSLGTILDNISSEKLIK